MSAGVTTASPVSLRDFVWTRLLEGVPDAHVAELASAQFSMPADDAMSAVREVRQSFAAMGWEDSRPADPLLPRSFSSVELEDVADVAAQGRVIAAEGVPYLLDGIIPAYGMLGFLVAYAKVGKTTFGQVCAAHIANGKPFLGRETTASRVLVLAAEDPPEYTAWIARHLDLPRGRMTIRRRSLLLTPEGLAQIVATIREHNYGLVLIASWQAVVRGLVRDENDNAGAVVVVENVKAAARQTGIPWLIDAHSGKGEDQTDDADPSKAMRGASAAAGAADYMLSLRYGNGAFGTERRLSGKGRFVSFPPITMDFDPGTSSYTVLGAAKDVTSESTWRLIDELGAVTTTPRSAAEIARLIGEVGKDGRVGGQAQKRIHAALQDRSGVGYVSGTRRGRQTKLYLRQEDSA